MHHAKILKITSFCYPACTNRLIYLLRIPIQPVAGAFADHAPLYLHRVELRHIRRKVSKHDIASLIIKIFFYRSRFVVSGVVKVYQDPAESFTQLLQEPDKDPAVGPLRTGTQTSQCNSPNEWNLFLDRLTGVLTGLPTGYHPFQVFHPMMCDASSRAITVYPIAAWRLTSLPIFFKRILFGF